MIIIRNYLMPALMCLYLICLTSEVTAQDRPSIRQSSGVDIMITQSPKILVKLDGITHNTCYGESKGAINISAHGGFPPYKYYWSNSDTTQDVAGLAAGTYRVAVYDNFSCSDTLEVKIMEPDKLVGTVESVTDILCYGYNNGEVNIAVTGGKPPYEFRWSDGSTQEDLKGVNSGRYSVLITDANHCQEIVTADVLEKPLIVRSIDHVSNILCYGDSTGSVDITVEGGVPPYSFLWNTGQTTEDIDHLPAGEYQVTVKDSQGCTEISSTRVVQPDQLTVGFDQVKNLQCNGDFGGAINIHVKGGKQPYVYKWSNGATTQDIAGIAAGRYAVQVTDANGCEGALSVTITEPETLVLTLDASKNVSYHGGSDGALDISVRGGTAPYRYKWSNDSTSQDISDLPAGTYTVRVTDAGGCASIMNVTITEPDPLMVKLDNIKDVACFGDQSGEVNVSVYGGVRPYRYSWSNGAVVEDISDVSAGTYSLTVTDANGYQQQIEASVSQPAEFEASVVKVSNILCHDQSTGAVDIDAKGGVQPYRYRWSNGEISQDIDNLSAGVYQVKVLDANNCELELSVEIRQPEDLRLSLNKFDFVKCAGDTTGSIDISVVGGVKPYRYKWSNGATTEDLQKLHADTYMVVVTDNNGCTVELTQRITEPDKLILSEKQTQNADCNGSYTGSVEMNIAGGVTPYSFRWSSGDTTLSIHQKKSGIYSLNVTDSYGCTTSFSKEITEPSRLICKVVEVKNNFCFGNSNGAVNIDVTGGVEPYTYRWSNGATTQDIVDVKAGKYAVVIRDANGCEDELEAVVTENPPLTANLNVTNIKCYGQKTGSVNLHVQGGVSPYAYAWSNDAATRDISQLPSGNYSVIVTDAVGCIVSLDAQVTEPPRFVATLESEEHLKCFEEHTGAINVRVSGGVLPYDYRWSNGDTTRNIRQLAVGDYVLKATDANGCVQTVSTSLTQPPKINYAIKSVTDVMCNGVREGAVDISVSGGVGPFSYQWSNGASTQDIQAVAAGEYAVKITDYNGCENTLKAQIKEPESLAVKLIDVVHILCSGEKKGAIDIAVTGGVKPYTYSWSNGKVNQDIDALSAGAYSVTVMDANGCTRSVNATINEPTPLVASIADVQGISCYGDKKGSISIHVKGGAQPYTYHWSNGSSLQNISAIGAGTYSVDIVDANGCSQSLSATINQPPQLISDLIDSREISCFGGNDGSLDVTVIGGTAPYRYQWSNGATTQDLTNVPAGSYSLQITDARGCVDATIQKNISQPPLLQADIAGVKHIAKYGELSGEVDLTVSGGVPPYTYSWSNGAIVQDLKEVPGGNYSVQISDMNGCERALTTRINQPPALDVKLLSLKDVNCNGDPTGSISIAVTGGVPPYTYLWNNGDSTQNISSVPAGDYSVTVTDASGYRKSLNANIAQPSPLVLKVDSYQDILCYNDTSGEIKVTVTGGVEPYSYKWSSGQTTQDIHNIAAGDYSLTVTDGIGCQVVLDQKISQPEYFAVSFDKVSHVLCKGDYAGEILLNVSGGAKPYSYYWNNGARTKDITEQRAGNYSVKVTDANGCVTNLDTTLVEPEMLEAKLLTVVHNSCFGEQSGAINIDVQGGVKPYTFAWSNSSTSQNLSELPAGDYMVDISDANGCSRKLRTTVEEPVELMASVKDIVDVSCSGDRTGSVNVKVSGGTTPYEYLWSNGSIEQDLREVTAGSYELTVQDARGCSVTLTASIQEPAPLQASVDTIYHVMCNGEKKGMVDVIVTGGSRPYTYSWNNGANTEDLVDVMAGDYLLRVRDARGCQVNVSAVVREPEMLTVELENITDIQCFGQETGSATVKAVGGMAPYEFSWSNGATGSTLSNVSAGEYTAMVTDKNGCSASYSIIIKQPAELIKTIDAITDIRCNGDSTGSIYITVLGGAPPYQFEWSNGATTEDIRGLTAGTYQLTITESNGCQSFLKANIEEPSRFDAAVTDITDVRCFGDSTGAINLATSGGVEPYGYVWSNGAHTQNLVDVNADSYSVMVTDGNGCIRTLYAEVTQPPAMKLHIDSVKNVKCCGDNSGAIYITASGGVEPYDYQWSNGATTEDIENLILGVYTVNVTDANGCVVATNDDMTLYEQVVSKGKFTTRDILFDIGKSIIKPESFITINKIASFMKEHPDISFRIDGHTDSDGSDELNQKLSEDRSKAIRMALIKFGIRPNRLASKGFGESMPIATNETAEGRSYNRRVEFVALTGTLEGTLIENQIGSGQLSEDLME